MFRLFDRSAHMSGADEPGASAQPAVLEKKSDSRLRAMCEERVGAARQAMDATLGKQGLSE